MPLMPRFRETLEASLKALNTGYIDVYLFHNPAVMPRPGDGTGYYELMLEAKKQGKIRHIGISNHRLNVAMEAAESGLYEVIQFPFSMLSKAPDFELARTCEANGVGFVAMKALSGGLITNAAAAFAFMRQFPGVVPIWGIQHMHELEEFIEIDKNPPAFDDEMKKLVESTLTALGDDFCRGCGYCLPCPAKIPLNNAARIYFLVTRSPYKNFISPSFQAEMAKVDDCVHCNACKSRCPYGLDTPELIKRQYALYKQFVAEHADEVEEGLEIPEMFR